ncbi:uncharacterized protein LOC129595290 [Paramacrobiotus metropolitanus]|uniref:uncharacterized protein LOC129595290 n=1 Tax=Paramacrobiotus metropolitanus TaxID=2943436 RepID=UPI002445F8B0|nr:uncharacterized protein LOC129595290 [Paramacrobiotus metropolitanus]
MLRVQNQAEGITASTRKLEEIIAVRRANDTDGVNEGLYDAIRSAAEAAEREDFRFIAIRPEVSLVIKLFLVILTIWGLAYDEINRVKDDAVMQDMQHSFNNQTQINSKSSLS